MRGLIPLLAILALGAVPVPTIRSSVDEGVEIVPGDFVELDASDSVDSKLFKWNVEPATFNDGRPTYRVSSDRTKLSLASRTGTYRIQLIVANETDIADTKRTIVVGKPQPGPGPQPQPDIPPPPVTQFGFDVDVPKWEKLVTSERSKFAALALNYATMSSQIAAGKFTDKDKTVAECKQAASFATRDKNRESLGPTGVVAFQPFMAELGKKLKSLDEAGKLGGLPEMSAAWLELSEALAKVKP